MQGRPLSLVVVVVGLALAVAACSGDEPEVADGARGPTLEAMRPEPMTMAEVAALPQSADRSPVTFSDVGAELGFRRVPPPQRFGPAITDYNETILEPVTAMDAAVFPADPYGTSGVALVDIDGDDDLDLYVTNAEGTPNSLFVNQLSESGALGFVDEAQARGADVTAAETAGVCPGDVDNDGDADLFVVGNGSLDTLLINDGSGVFTAAPERLPTTLIAGGSTCAVGDINGDGLLDIAVAHTFDHRSSVALAAEPFELNLPNVLLLQQPDGTFVDEAESRGLRTLLGVPPGTSGISWGIALVDRDLDGDLDAVVTDDQTMLPTAARGGVDRGYVQIYDNDGKGQFTAVDVGTLTAGTWMGTAWADFDCDGALDMWAGNFGDYGVPVFGNPYDLGDYASRWLLGDGEGGYRDPGVGDVGATHFAWGGIAEDLDNDGDTDILSQGGLDAGLLVELSNPGTLLLNDGCVADFTAQQNAFPTVNHRARVVTGTAAGDLDGDGDVDVVTAASLVVPDQAPLFNAPSTYDLPTDGEAFFTSAFMVGDDGLFSYLGLEYVFGDLAIELNDGNANGWVAVEAVGAVGLTEGAVVPRSAYGAVVTVTREGGRPTTKPVQGGTGYLSSDSPIINAGLGQSATAQVDVLWPGGVRNRRYDVPSQTTLTMVEIPCSYDDTSLDDAAYAACVDAALADLVAAGAIDQGDAEAARDDALRARDEG